MNKLLKKIGWKTNSGRTDWHEVTVDFLSVGVILLSVEYLITFMGF